MSTVQQVSRKAARRLKCQCGHVFNRQRTFTSTGEPGAFMEIWAELGEECDRWTPDNLCTTCSDKGGRSA